MSETLIVDNSNTRTKFAWLTQQGQIIRLQRHPTKNISSELIAQILTKSPINQAVVCSVVPWAAEVILAGIRTHLPPEQIHRVTCLSHLPMAIDYPDPAGIGADRLANAAAATRLGSLPIIVVDFGTAVTFDILGANAQNQPSYLGGVIAPGLASLKTELSAQTALLPEVELSPASPAFDSVIGKSTTHAMQIGALVGYRGLVREILRELSSELGTQARVITTGGDAPLITQHLAEVNEYSETLTLEGIYLIGSINLPAPG